MSICEPKEEQKIGVWISDKKSQKLNWKELISTCCRHGYKVVKLDMEKPLEHQQNFDVFLHKLTDIIAAADQGDPKASVIISRVEQYLSNRPNIIVIDPIDNVRILLNRYKYYTILEEEPTFKKAGIFTPPFAEFMTSDVAANLQLMKQRGLRFPVICKPSVAHGSKSAHEMTLVFNARGLRACKPPCVVQTFINHNAVLHKVFVVGNRYHICQRPSIKNFYACEDLEPIYYSTGEVCKADSHSTLSILDPHDDELPDVTMTLNEAKIKHIIRVISSRIGLILAGFDVVIDNSSGHHAVIDINVFPGYDTFPDFFENLLECVEERAAERRGRLRGDSSIIDVIDHRTNGLINVGLIANNGSVTGMSLC